MQPELDELLSGLRHLRRRAARGDLAWINIRYGDGRLEWLQKLLPPGGYDRLGRDLANGNAVAVRRALANIDDATVGERLGYRTVTRRVGPYPPEDEPLLVSIEPDVSYVTQPNTAPHHPLEEFAIDPEPLETNYDFGGVDDPYFRDDVAFDDRFDAAMGTGYDAAGYDDRSDRIVIVDDAVAGRAGAAPRPRTNTIGYPPSGPFGDEPKRPNPLTWLFMLAALVLLFAVIFSRCGSDDPDNLSTNSTTTVAQQTGTQGVVTATGATTPVTTGGATSGVRAPTTWVIYFAINSTTIDSSGQQVVKEVSDRVRAYGAGTPVVITGHSDTTGNPAANLQLAQTRAQVVRDAIEAAVPQLARFSVESKGDQQPDPDPAKSRRVTVTVS